MTGQHPLTIALLVVAALLGAYIVFQIVRIVGVVVLGMLQRQPPFDRARWESGHAAIVAELAAMPMHDARAEADRAIADGTYVLAAPPDESVAAAHAAAIASLGPELRAFFARWRSAGQVAGETWIAADEVAPWVLPRVPDESAPPDVPRGPFLRLGPGSSDGHVELLARPGSDVVTILDEGEVTRELATVWHWIAYVDRTERLYVAVTARPPTT